MYYTQKFLKICFIIIILAVLVWGGYYLYNKYLSQNQEIVEVEIPDSGVVVILDENILTLKDVNTNENFDALLADDVTIRITNDEGIFVEGYKEDLMINRVVIIKDKKSEKSNIVTSLDIIP